MTEKGDMMYLADVAEVRTGLVLSRKKANDEDLLQYEYKALNLKCMMPDGYLVLENSEVFISNEKIKPDFLTQRNDVLVRLSNPYTAVYITEEAQCGYVIPSHFAIIRAYENLAVPEYINWFLKRDTIKQKITQNGSGSTAFGTISSGFLASLEMRDMPISEQMIIGKLLLLAEKEQELLYRLAENKAKYNKMMINTIYDRIKRGN